MIKTIKYIAIYVLLTSMNLVRKNENSFYKLLLFYVYIDKVGMQ